MANVKRTLLIVLAIVVIEHLSGINEFVLDFVHNADGLNCISLLVREYGRLSMLYQTLYSEFSYKTRKSSFDPLIHYFAPHPPSNLAIFWSSDLIPTFCLRLVSFIRTKMYG